MKSLPGRQKPETLQCNVKDQTDILYLSSSKVFENRDQIKKLIVVSIRKPAADRYRVLGMENIGCRRVVNNDCLSNITPDLG